MSEQYSSFHEYDHGYWDGYWGRPLLAQPNEHYLEGFYDGIADSHDEPEFEGLTVAEMIEDF